MFQENPIYNFNRFALQVCRDFSWRVSDVEELVRVAHRRDDVVCSSRYVVACMPYGRRPISWIEV